jgi:hypothetical protein
MCREGEEFGLGKYPRYSAVAVQFCRSWQRPEIGRWVEGRGGGNVIVDANEIRDDEAAP